MRQTFATLICLLLCCLVGVSSDQPNDGKLEGSVVDIVENAPITYAFVFIHTRNSADKVLKLGFHGEFQTTLTPGIYDIFIAAPGFAPTCKAISIHAGETTQFVAKLRADNEHLQQD